MNKLIVLAISLSSISATQYCATINSNQADGASGYVAVEIANGKGKYSFSLNLGSSTFGGCTLSGGLKYHFHSYWLNGTSASASSNAYCNQAGGHYDPNFACSKNSQSISTSCVELQRTPAFNYTYACNSSLYTQGKYSYCEVGDTSGKNGFVYASTDAPTVFSLTTPFLDYQPPYPVNYNYADVNSLPWTSWVFHCVSPDLRLVCAKFSPTDLSACSAAFAADDDATANSSNDDNTFTNEQYTAAVLISVLVTFVCALALGFILKAFCFPRCCSRDDSLTKPVNSSV